MTDSSEIYKVNKNRFERKFQLKQKKTLIFTTKKFDPLYNKVIDFNYVVRSQDEIKLVKAEFGEADLLIIDNLGRLENVAIGDHYPKTLKPNVTKTIQTGIERGLNKAQAGEFLKAELTKKIGGQPSAVPRGIQLQGQKSVNAYFKGLNATNVTTTRNFGQIQLMREAEITRYVWNSIVDNLTSQICLQMDGRVFEVAQAQEQMQKILEAENVEQVQNIAPFKRDLSEFGLGAGEKLEDTKTSQRLAAAGITLPPVHFRCRSEVNPF